MFPWHAFFVVLALASSWALGQEPKQSMPVFAEPKKDWEWDEDKRFNFLMERLASLEASLDALDQAIAKAIGKKGTKLGEARRAEANNTMMDRKGGGPMKWNEFYGTTAEKFFYHPVDPNTTYHTSTVLKQMGSSQDDKIGAGVPASQSLPVHQRPPQFDYIYRANRDAKERAEAEASALEGQLEALSQRREQLEAEQAELWCRLAFRAIQRLNIPRRPLLRFHLVAASAEAEDEGKSRVLEAAARFLSSTLLIIDKAESDQAVAFGNIKVIVASARNDFDDALLEESRGADDSGDKTTPLGQFVSLAQLLDDTANNLSESYEVAIDGGAFKDVARKEQFRGLLQRSLVEYAQIVMALDELTRLMQKEWNIKVDTKKKVPSVEISWERGSSPTSVRPSGGIKAKPDDGTKSPRRSEAGKLENSIGVELTRIPAGTFIMGALNSADNQRAHAVTLTKPFYIGVYEITNAQWKRIMGSVPSREKGDNHPVDGISWIDAVTFCEKMSELPMEKAAGRVYRLPTEAEWEYACRAGKTTAWFFGDDEKALGDYAWLQSNSEEQTHPVGQKKPNPWGLYDVYGNVPEWCHDWYAPYPPDPVTDPVGPPSGSRSTGNVRVLRGFGISVSGSAGATWRDRSPPSSRAGGIRVAMTAEVIAPPGDPPARQGGRNTSDRTQALGRLGAGHLEATNSSQAESARTFKNSVGIDLNLIPGTTFMMGDATGGRDEKPFQVIVTKPFYIGVYEVTNAQWNRVMGNVPSKWKTADHPVEQVSWDDVNTFCRKLSALPKERAAGRTYRLPTEAEWECACRSATTAKYSFGDDEARLGDYGWFAGNSGKKSHPKGQKKPNGWGLYDMHGNVAEWCSDWYGSYPASAMTDPTGRPQGFGRVNRGGAWSSISADLCRSSSRNWGDPVYRRDNLGFRLVMSAAEQSPQDTEK